MAPQRDGMKGVENHISVGLMMQWLVPFFVDTMNELSYFPDIPYTVYSLYRQQIALAKPLKSGSLDVM